MGWAYSVDLRERVIAAFDVGDFTDEQVAALFKVGEATVHRWKRLRRETGALEPKAFGGGMPPRVGPEHHELVRAIVREQPDLTVQEVAWESPIELCWSKLKALLKEFGARTQQALDWAIRRAMDFIGADDAEAWFSHCGYGAHVK